MTDGLKPEHRRAIIETLSANPKVERVVLFGSRAMGTFTPTSDIDLALFGDDLTLSDQAALAEAMAELSIPQRVDILIHHRIENRALREHIRKHGVEWFARGRAAGTAVMGGEWIPIKLADVCTKIGSGATPRGGSEVYREQGPYALIRSQNVYNRGFHRDGLVYIGEKHAAELEGVEVTRNDVLLNITGDSVARACQVDPGVLPARVNQHVAIIRSDPEKLDPRFLRYVLVSPEMQAKLLSWAGAGGTRNSLTKAMIESLEVLAPKDIGEQRAIAHILGTLDDKIELNRRMSETLEAMARALFQSWFVDFEPVRAKMERRDPGLPGRGGFETRPYADLFPDRLVESELGEIPEGWVIGTLGDVAQHPRRGVQPDRIKPETPYIALEHMPKHCIALFDWGVADRLASNKFEFRKGEILFGRLRPYFHKVGVAPVDGVCSTDIVVVAPRHPHWFAFVLSVVSSDEFVEYTNACSTGTKTPSTSWADMARYAIALPPVAVVQAFTERVRPLVDRIITGIHESRTLAALRDVLLPKLISGELRVKDAKAFLKERGL